MRERSCQLRRLALSASPDSSRSVPTKTLLIDSPKGLAEREGFEPSVRF